MVVDIKEVGEDEVEEIQLEGETWEATVDKVKAELETLIRRQSEAESALEKELFQFLVAMQSAHKAIGVELRETKSRVKELTEEVEHKKEYISKVFQENSDLSKKNRELEKKNKEIAEECKIAQDDCMSQFRACCKCSALKHSCCVEISC